MLKIKSPRRTYFPLAVKDFTWGLLTRESNRDLPPGAATRSENCDYQTGSIESRQGYASILENGPGATKIADFESGESWSGGIANTVPGEFVVTEVLADGAQSRALAWSGTPVSSELVVAQDLDHSDDQQVINVWVHGTTIAADILTYAVTLRFEQDGANYFEIILATETSDPLEAGRGKYYRRRKRSFEKTGGPSWGSITKIVLEVDATRSASGSLSVSFDNLHRTASVIQDLFQFRRTEGDFAGGKDEYCIAGGSLYRNIGARWDSTYSGFDATAPVYSVTAQDRRYMTDGVTTPRVLMPDGETVYRMGIVGPPRQITASKIDNQLTQAEIDAGATEHTGLPDGKYYIQVLYYSSKTGTFSAPDERVPATETIDIITNEPIGEIPNTAGIKIENIPESSDPQVDWVVIGIRPQDEPSLFLRASNGVFGEVENGTTEFEFNGTLTELLGRSGTAIDPDMDYPSYTDRTTEEQVEAHPKYLAEIGGYLVCVMAERPSVLRISRFRQPGSWAIDDEIPVGENDSEEVSGIKSSASTLVPGKRNNLYYGKLVGGDEKVLLQPPASDRGPVDHKSMIVVGHYLYYRGQDALYQLGQDMLPRIATEENMKFWKELWSTAGFGLGAAAIIRDREQMLHFGNQRGADGNNKAWVTHYRTVLSAHKREGDWAQWATSIYDLPGDVATEVQTGTDYETWTGGDGQVWRLNHGREDDGRPIQVAHKTALISPDPGYVYRWKWVDIEGEISGAFSVTVNAYFGTAIVADASPAASMQGNSTPLGTLVLGTDRLGASGYYRERLNLPRIASRYISLEFVFSGRARMSIDRMTLWHRRIGTKRSTM